MKMTSSCIVLVAAVGFSITQTLLTPASAQSQETKSKDLCGRQLNEPVATFLDRLVKLEGASITLRTSEFVGVRDKADINWSFTVAGHPAHPSVACRKVVQVDGAFRVLTMIECQANKQACDDLAAAYKQLDKRMMEAMEKERQKK